MIKKIYFDLDGTLVDFKKGAEDIGWKTYEQDKDNKDDGMWELIKNTPHFYANLKPLDGAIEFFKGVVERHGKDVVEILTGCPKEKRGIITAKEDKIAWCKKYLGDDIKVNLCTREEKVKFCKGKEYILVDDLESNCNDWKEAGGIAFRVIDIKTTFDELYKYEAHDHWQDIYESEGEGAELIMDDDDDDDDDDCECSEGKTEELIEIHNHSFKNGEEIKKSKKCGCYSCKQIYDASLIVDYIEEDDGKKTAICPKCMCDAVIGDASGCEINEEVLIKLNKEWF